MKRCFLKHILQAGRKRDPEAPTPRGRMATDFTVQSVLVTGSSKGIGLGLVKQFLMLPTPPQWVFATTNQDMDGPKNKEVKELASLHQNLVLLHLDVTDLKSIKAAVEQVQKYVGECGLNLLMNNAGIHLESTLETENAKDMAAEYAINTVGPLQVSQAALNMLTKCQSLAYPDYGILCVCIHPGWVKTRRMDADLTVEESTRGIMNVLSTLSEEDNGTFVDWEGRRVPW
ncbi:uncharacterized protein LOC133369257 isoform X2 [Rhineura floridana]|uniref:uncharacterized protein LOC133369257 isoform X2 n=1 Tax=Rhineura floridana TaxID=261503 RepID=UPI002AC84AB8|nr:uncharacterized protein LOC133369257 isoform X2 [Rhineura floridana]